MIVRVTPKWCEIASDDELPGAVTGLGRSMTSAVPLE
jgi:hypothetical protein